MLGTSYRIQESTRRCARTGRELQPGEVCYSVLYERNGELVREDFSAEAWSGLPAEAFCFWRGRVPPREARRRIVYNDDALWDCFLQLDNRTELAALQMRYVLALLLIRRRRLRLDQVDWQDGVEILRLSCARSRTTFSVINPGLSEPELQQVQEQIHNLLGLT